ncbi:hypothetical protein LINPERHAP1_LOCUS4190 [Linum perenne]
MEPISPCNLKSDLRAISSQTCTVKLLRRGTRTRGRSFCKVSPNFSSISNSITDSSPYDIDQSKFQTKLAKSRGIYLAANGVPGHILRPALNGNSCKSCPRKSTLDPTNLSGLNDAASSPQIETSRPIAHALTATRAPFGIV